MPKPFSILKIILMSGCMISFFISPAQDYYNDTKAKDKPVKEKSYTEKGFSISVSVGSAVPTKSFSSTNVKNSFWDFNSVDSVKLQGFAKTGIHFNITTSYLFPNGIGIMSMIGNNANSFDIHTFAATVGVPFTTVEGFHTREFLIGPYFSFAGGSNFTFEANTMIGIVTANYPTITQTVVDTTEAIKFNSGSSLGFSIGGTVKYGITRRISVSVNVSYLQAKIVYHGWTDTYTAPGYYPYVIEHPNDIATMPIGILKITGGFVFKFH